MARSTRSTPRKVSNSSANGVKANGTLLNFFKQDPKANVQSRSDAVNGAVKVEENNENRQSGYVKGKGKALNHVTESGDGSAVAPLVISDDEDIVRSKRRKTRQSSSPRTFKPIKSPVKLVSDLEEDEKETVAGPSRPRQSCSPPPPVIDAPDFVEPPNPFPNLPGFKPPSSWPQIVNTAEDPDTLEIQDNLDPGNVDDDQIEMIDVDVDESVRDLQSADEAESEDEAENKDPTRPAIQSDYPSADVIPTDQNEDQSLKPNGVTSNEPVHSFAGPNIAFEAEIVWDEPEDEGMGMDEEGDEDVSDIIATPPPRRPTGKPGGFGKVTECPVCGSSMKGKAQPVVQRHINKCLDKKSSGPRIARPITSFNHTFSPAPSTPSPPPEEVVKGPNAFSVLMSGHKEKEEWKDAEIDLKRDGKRFFGRRKAPFYKVLTGMPVAVDAFRYGAIPKVNAYLLTHAHSDHYTNLSRSWKEGPIYCSETTANLIVHMLGVEPKWVHGLPNDIPFEMPNTGGVKVTPIEANHCPGSSIFLFEGQQTVNAGDSTFKSPYVGSKRMFRYLHCGDFRACPKMVLHPAIARAKIDTCYLDTTYLNPKYCFPPQPQVIEACATLARKIAVGISSSAMSLEDIKPDIKSDTATKFDIKPDVNTVHAENEEKSKAMMAGWLVKRESEEDVKAEPQEPAAATDWGDSADVKAEGQDDTDAVFGGVDVKPEMGQEEDVKPKGEDEKLMEVRKKPNARSLVIMGTYSIGKERIVKAVAKALGTKIYCDPRKKGLLLCQTDPELHSMLSSDPYESQVHLVPLGNIQLDRLQPYLAQLYPHFDRVLGFRPTGWAYTPPAGTDMLPDVNQVIRRDQSRSFADASLRPMRGSCKQFMMYGVPYSEHSSFFELTCFALSLPGPDVKMIATVNVGNEKSRAKMKKWFEKWQAEKLKRKDKNLPSIVDYRDETFW